MNTQAPTSDGRRARRDRNRATVIDALFELLHEGALPATDEIADRAGVSVSSVFRYFDSLEDLHRQTIRVHFDRFGSLFEIPTEGVGDLAGRIERFIDARLVLHDAVAPIARLARSRAIDQPVIAETVDETRRSLAAQVRRHFRTELDQLTPSAAADTVDAIDALTSFESWDLLTGVHGRTARQIRRGWLAAIRRLLGAA